MTKYCKYSIISLYLELLLERKILMKKLLSLLLAFSLILGLFSSIPAAAEENYEITEDLSTISGLEADLQNPEKNISYLYSAGAKGAGGTITYSYFDKSGTEKVISPGYASYLTNGVLNEKTSDIHAADAPLYVDVETGEASGLALHITFNFPNEATVNAVVVASLNDFQYYFYTQEYEVYASDSNADLYSASNKLLTYNISNNSQGQYIKFKEPIKTRFVGIKITKGLIESQVPEGNRKYSYARLREVAALGTCEIPESELITSAKRTNESKAKLKTDSHLNFGYPVDNSDVSASMTVRGFDKGTPANSGSLHSYHTTNDLCDGDVSTEADINAYVSGVQGQICFLENGAFKQNTSVDVTTNLLFESLIDSVFIAQRSNTMLRANEYEIYAGNDYATLYTEANKQVYYLNEAKAQYQTFVFETPVKAKYIGIRILQGVTLPEYTIADSSSYARLCEIAVFGKYNVPYYDYTVSSNPEGLVTSGGNDYQSKELRFYAPLTSAGKSFVKWTVNGEDAEYTISNFENHAWVDVVLDKELDIVAVYEDDPTELTSDKFNIFGDYICLPYNSIVYEVKKDIDQYAANVAVIDNETTLEKHEYVDKGMKVALYANSEIAEEKIVLISGDYNGDSKVTVTDILGTIDVINGQGVSGDAAAAIDYDGNGTPSVTDLVMARNAIISTPAERVDYSSKYIESADLSVKVSGREYRDEEGAIYLENPGSGIMFNLNCYGTVLLNINIQSIPIYSAYFTIIIDGKETEISVPDKGDTLLTIAEDLKKGVHTFEVYGTQGQVFTVFGVDCSGTMLSAPQNKDRYIEVIGDSITAGADNMGRRDGVYVEDRTQNSYYAYGMVTARLLNADIAQVARGGSAAVMMEGMRNTHIPSIYKQITIDKKTSVYDFARKPDVVVINLGTNDNGLLNKMYSTTSEKRAAFKTAIKGLVDLVYEGYGKDVPIVFAFGFMTDENYMDEVYKELASELTNAGGEAYYVRMPTCRNGGSGHPDIAGDIAGAEVLAKFIEETIYK